MTDPAYGGKLVQSFSCFISYGGKPGLIDFQNRPVSGRAAAPAATPVLLSLAATTIWAAGPRRSLAQKSRYPSYFQGIGLVKKACC